MSATTLPVARRGRQNPATGTRLMAPRVRASDRDRLPHDAEAEEALLGGLLIDDVRFPDVARIVQPAHFWGPGRAAVFTAMVAARQAGQQIDNVTMRAALEKSDEPPPPDGWSAELTRLASRVPTAAHVAHYAAIVRQKANQRQLIAVASSVAMLGHDGADDALDQARALLAALDFDIERAETGDVNDALADLLEPRPDGWSTGVGVIDQWLGDVGLVPGRILTLSGKSGVGKTWLSCTAALSAMEAGARVGFFTLEMTRAEVLTRMAAPRLGGRVFRLLRAPDRWTAADHDAHRDVVQMFDRRPLAIFQAQRSAFDIAVKARAARLDVAVVDWYQQLDDTWGEGLTSDQIDRAHALALLDVAMRGPCCVIAVSQLNKDGSMKYGAWLNAYSAAHLTMANGDDGSGTVIIRPEKNRWGADSAGGSTAKFHMDKSRGVLTPVVSEPDAPKRSASRSRADLDGPTW